MVNKFLYQFPSYHLQIIYFISPPQVFNLLYWIMKKICITTFVLISFNLSFSQNNNQKGFLDDFKASASITNNGLSLIPTFSLGDPAILFDVKLIKGKYSFEPDIRYSLDGKPWIMLFWFRHKTIEKKNFTLRTGIHPAVNFRTIQVKRDIFFENIIEARRFIAAEIAPNFRIRSNISLGAYYLYSRGLDNSQKNNHFIVANSLFSNINLFDNYQASVSPQVYYLKQDKLDGLYTVGFFTINKKLSPISLSFTFNKAIETKILPEDDFTWNVSINYKFK